MISFYRKLLLKFQSQDFLEKEAQVAGSEYMQGIVRYCTALHDTNTGMTFQL